MVDYVFSLKLKVKISPFFFRLLLASQKFCSHPDALRARAWQLCIDRLVLEFPMHDGSEKTGPRTQTLPGFKMPKLNAQNYAQWWGWADLTSFKLYLNLKALMKGITEVEKNYMYLPVIHLYKWW